MGGSLGTINTATHLWRPNLKDSAILKLVNCRLHCIQSFYFVVGDEASTSYHRHNQTKACRSYNCCSNITTYKHNESTQQRRKGKEDHDNNFMICCDVPFLVFPDRAARRHGQPNELPRYPTLSSHENISLKFEKRSRRQGPAPTPLRAIACGHIVKFDSFVD
jgi:hypothetical protein